MFRLLIRVIERTARVAEEGCRHIPDQTGYTKSTMMSISTHHHFDEVLLEDDTIKHGDGALKTVETSCQIGQLPHFDRSVIIHLGKSHLTLKHNFLRRMATSNPRPPSYSHSEALNLQPMALRASMPPLGVQRGISPANTDPLIP